jgi:hypothetical protein
MTNRKELISILSKKREEYYQNLPTNNGDKELRLLCDIISSWIISGSNSFDNGNFRTNRHQVTNSKELQYSLKALLNIEAKEEDIQKVRSSKKILCLRNNRVTYRIYRQSF